MDPFAERNPMSRFTKVKSLVKKIVPEEKFALMHTREENIILGIVWVVSSLLTVLIPLIHRTIHKNKYREVYMSYYWEQEYEYEEEQRQQNYEMYGNSYNYGGAYMQQYDEKEYYDVNNCKWWKINCFSFYINGDGQVKADQDWAPAWYSGFITTEEERQEMQDNLESPGSLEFVYVWQILMFIAIGLYGLKVIRENRNPTGLIIALLTWANFAFLSMWLMADGSIVTDGNAVKRTGFYGQISVLIFMTNFWYFLHGLAFILVFWIRSTVVAKEEEIIAAKAEETK